MLGRRGLMVGFSLLVTGYFAFHAVYGSRGLVAWYHLTARKTVLVEQLEAKRQSVTALENRVQGLRPRRIDPDLLDERVRAMLGYVAADEVVVLEKAAPPKRSVPAAPAPTP